MRNPQLSEGTREIISERSLIMKKDIKFSTRMASADREKIKALVISAFFCGVGGGMIRDMMAQQIPFILVKQIYACASLAGAGVCIWLMPYHKSASMILGAVVVVIIRILAATYRWDLPKIE